MTIPGTDEPTATRLLDRHLLDPLTEDEINQTTAILRAAGRITPQMRLMAYSLHEPPKEVVLAFQVGQPVVREVAVVIRDHERRLTIEALVSLNEEKIRSWQERDDVQPALTYPEVFAAQQAILGDPSFEEALKRRGITDLASVVLYPWTSGYRSADDAAQLGRFIRMAAAQVHGAEDNYYAHPIEGVIATVELDRMSVQIEDFAIVPVPAHAGNYTAAGIQD